MATDRGQRDDRLSGVVPDTIETFAEPFGFVAGVVGPEADDRSIAHRSGGYVDDCEDKRRWGRCGQGTTLRKLRDTDQTISSSDEDIRGRRVKDKDGRDIGKIEGLMVDDVEQKVRFIEVATGGFLGFGETRSFIPVEAITRISEGEVSISHTGDRVAGAPRYDPSLVATDTHYFFNLYPYYGYQGYLGFYRLGASYPYAEADRDHSSQSGGLPPGSDLGA